VDPPEGAGLRRGNFRRSAKWDENKVKAGLPEDFRFHDRRHTGNQLAAEAGASTKELMHRMGHSTVRAALVYQHATTKRDRHIAAEMSRQAKVALGKKKGGRRGKG
jgi:integrase